MSFFGFASAPSEVPDDRKPPDAVAPYQAKDRPSSAAGAAVSKPFLARLGSIGDGGLLQRSASISSEGWDFGALKAEDFEEHLRAAQAAANGHPSGGDAVGGVAGAGGAGASFDVSVDGVFPRFPSAASGYAGSGSPAGPAALLRQASWSSAVLGPAV